MMWVHVRFLSSRGSSQLIRVTSLSLFIQSVPNPIRVAQERLAGLKDQASVREARLMDQIEALRRQLRAEGDAR